MKTKQILIRSLYGRLLVPVPPQGGLPRQTANLRWCPAVGPPDGVIESANAAKTCRKSDLRHRQHSLINQFLGELKTACLRYRARRGSQISQEQTPQVTRADSQPLGQKFHPTLFQARFADQPQSAGNRIGSSGGSRGSRRTFRPATQTRAETGFGGRRGSKVVANIFFLRGARRADRAAVNSSAENRDIKPAVEARIARESGPRTHLPIQIHCRQIHHIAPSRAGLDVFGPAIHVASGNVQHSSQDGFMFSACD